MILEDTKIKIVPFRFFKVYPTMPKRIKTAHLDKINILKLHHLKL